MPPKLRATFRDAETAYDAGHLDLERFGMSDGSTPRFLQGSFEFVGSGYDTPALIDDSLRYVVPPGTVTQPLYFRGGSSCDEMVTVGLFRDGKPMRYFPIAAKGGTNTPLRVIEDLLGDTVLELLVLAPSGAKGTLIIDFGLVEV
jgi:hypothetical protein